MIARSPRRTVLLACVLVVVLGAALTVRLAARPTSVAPSPQSPAPAAVVRPIAPPAGVPDPKPLDPTALEMPCWSCPEGQQAPLAFKTDLDLLAPLGTGSGNAAVWFAAFTKPDGPRAAEAEAARKRMRTVDGAASVGGALPPNDPLLLEAAPWIDQAAMHFHPDLIPLEGYRTRVPNLLLALNLARSWVARGVAAPDDASALADFRRVIRLGRLLRQDDVLLVNDLIGIACIRIGAEAIYNRTRATDPPLAMLAAVVAGEAAAQRLLTQQRAAALPQGPWVQERGAAGLSDLRSSELENLVEMGSDAPERRFRLEAILALGLVRQYGRATHRAEARSALDRLAADPDRLVAEAARRARDVDIPEKELASLAGGD